MDDHRIIVTVDVTVVGANYKSPHTAPSHTDGHVALVLNGTGVDGTLAHQYERLPGCLLSFPPMDNTMELGPRIEEEPAVDHQANTQSQEEHIILSTINDAEDVDYGDDEVITGDISCNH